MTTEKKAVWVVFRPTEPVNLKKMREMYLGSYPHFADMASLFSKTWWVDEARNEWGALYVFNSQQDVDAYLSSERWLKKVPEKYGCRPEVVRVLDIGVILAKEMVTQGENSWLAKD